MHGRRSPATPASTTQRRTAPPARPPASAAQPLGSGLNLGATFTNVPGGTAHWTFAGGTNYNDQSGDVAIVINKADATVTVSGYTGIYDAAAHGATRHRHGRRRRRPRQPASTSARSFTNVPGGTAHWTFTGGTNYNDQSGDVAITITYAPTGSSCLGQPANTILQPINVDGSSVFKQGSTVPAKFRVCDANGKSVGIAGVVDSFSLVKTLKDGAIADVNEAVDSTTPDSTFRWSATDQLWIFNISTKDKDLRDVNTKYTFRVTLNDRVTSFDFSFSLK